MKLTALDIHHKEFRHSLRGYSEEEVDTFLDQVADEFDRLFKENIDLSERLEQAMDRVRGYQSMETTLNNTLVSAQRSAEDIVRKAGNEAESMLRDSEMKAREIIHTALQKKQAVAGELIRIKQAEEEFRERYTSMLEGELRGVHEITLPSDIDMLLDDSDKMIGTVEVRVAEPVRETPAVMPEATPEEAAMPVENLEPLELEEPMAGVFDAVEEMDEVPLIDPPASGFVSSVSLGEVESPEMPSGPVDLIEPDEFELPGFETLGERESDTDIEEID